MHFFAWWVWKYEKSCNIIHIQALSVVIPYNAHYWWVDHILGDRIMGSVGSVPNPVVLPS